MTRDSAAWERAAVGEVLRQCDYGLSCALSSEPDGVPILRMGNLRGGRVALDDLKYVPTATVKAGHLLASGDILLNRTNSIDLVGKSGLFMGGPKLTFASYLFRLRVDGERASAAWLAQVLGSSAMQERLRQIATPGVSQANINRERLRALDILLPPLPEQRKIAAILWSMDDAIETTQAVIDQLDVVKKALMAELLTRGLPGRRTRFKMTEIGELPEGWEVVRLGDVCERMFVGIAQAATHAYVTRGGVPIIRTTNVRPNLLRTDDILRINETFADEMRSKRLRAGDVLSARTGYPGTSIVVPDEFDGAQCFTLLVSRPGPRLLPRFMCHVMNSEIGARIVQHGQAGGAQQNLNVGVFEAACVGLPSVEEQRALCACVDALYEREWSDGAALVGLRALKSALMSVLLTGEIRVKPDEAA